MDIEAVIEGISFAAVSDERRRDGLEIVKKLLSNIRDSPDQEKFRSVKKNNAAIQSRLFPECLPLLQYAGFEDAGDILAFRGEPGPEFIEALTIVESLLLSLGDAPSSPERARQAPAATPATASSPSSGPRASQKEVKARTAAQKAQASQAQAQQQLEELRRRRSGRYQEEQDAALARHLSSLEGDSAFDPITALNVSRSAHSFITCSRCGTALRYSATTRAQAVLCPCGTMLQPIHLRGQAFRPQSPSDLPVEPGVPVDSEHRVRAGTRGPVVNVRGPDGEVAQLSLHTVLQMVRQQQEREHVVASDETIEALPTRRFEASAAGPSADDSRCQICMEDFQDGEELRTLPCFHPYHAKCVDQWLKVNSICPTCRHKVG